MNFGEKLKQLRQLKSLSQPELAAAIGIEQSYLSKLENDKSVPSPEMLQRILVALDVTLDEMLTGISDEEIRNQLKAIPQVVAHTQQREAIASRNRNIWIATSAVLLSLGFSFLVAGSGALLFPEIAYNYQSDELVPKGDNGEVFGSIDDFLNYKFAPTHSDLLRSGASEVEIETARNLQYLAFASLSMPDYVLSYENLGIAYTADVSNAAAHQALAAAGLNNGATRTYRLHPDLLSPMQPRAVNSQLMFVGLAMLIIGLIGFLTRICRFFADYLLYRRRC